MSVKKTYIGDGVYCEYLEPYGIHVYTSDGYSRENVICFDYEMIKSLYDFVQKNMNQKGEKESGR